MAINAIARNRYGMKIKMADSERDMRQVKNRIITDMLASNIKETEFNYIDS
jgi:hypothetical protein